jgi:opacity protein-like surface antigen
MNSNVQKKSFIKPNTLKIAIMITLTLGVKYNLVRAQNLNDTLVNKMKHFELFSNGGYGQYFPLDRQLAFSQSSSVYFFQLQIQYKQHYFARLAFDQYSINYKENTQLNGLDFKINNKVQAVNFGIDFGYAFNVSKRISPFAYIGAGRVALQLPTIQYDKNTMLVDVSIAKQAFLSLRGGLGCEYEFNKYFIAFLETQYISIPLKKEISSKQLNGMSFIIGFKTRLQ